MVYAVYAGVSSNPYMPLVTGALADLHYAIDKKQNLVGTVLYIRMKKKKKTVSFSYLLLKFIKLIQLIQ